MTRGLYVPVAKQYCPSRVVLILLLASGNSKSYEQNRIRCMIADCERSPAYLDQADSLTFITGLLLSTFALLLGSQPVWDNLTSAIDDVASRLFEWNKMSDLVHCLLFRRFSYAHSSQSKRGSLPCLRSSQNGWGLILESARAKSCRKQPAKTTKSRSLPHYLPPV